MPQNTNLNVSPYFDDFVDSKNYHKVLFKPGFPVQARELTTLQSILQNQVEKFGQHFFKEGSMVIPGGTTYDEEYFSVKIDPNFLNIPVSNYTKVLADNKIKIKGETSGVEATVVNRLTSSESIDGFDTLYVKYTKSGSDGETSTFLDGENLITLSSFNYLNTSITADSQFARCIVSNSTSIGSAFSVSEGVYFIRGFFVRNVSSTVILDQYTNTPTYRVGFLLKEETVGPSSVNSDLYDNAKGFSNESAPGADRFKLSVTLHRKLITDTNDNDFVELLRVEDGFLARELYLRIASNEANFSHLASQFSQGDEAKTKGIVGPVSMNQAPPTLSEKLRTSRPGQLNEPFSIGKWWLVARLERYEPARFDELTMQAMTREMFQEHVEEQLVCKLLEIDVEA